ncbi:hypothetical protein HK102_001883, partial [Quaeritorhiza haematococci]
MTAARETSTPPPHIHLRPMTPADHLSGHLHRIQCAAYPPHYHESQEGMLEHLLAPGAFGVVAFIKRPGTLNDPLVKETRSVSNDGFSKERSRVEEEEIVGYCYGHPVDPQKPLPGLLVGDDALEVGNASSSHTSTGSKGTLVTPPNSFTFQTPFGVRPHPTFLHECTIDPTYQGRGIGRLLTERFIDEAALRGANAVASASENSSVTADVLAQASAGRKYTRIWGVAIGPKAVHAWLRYGFRVFKSAEESDEKGVQENGVDIDEEERWWRILEKGKAIP